MRTKSLPISVRANPPRHSPPPRSHPIGSGRSERRRRWLDVIATIVMVPLVPALLLPYSNAEASLERPVIVGRTVGAHAGGVSILAVIAVRFDRPVTGVSDKSFVLRDSNGSVVPAIVTYDASRNRAELLPLNALRADKRYEATVSKAIRSTGGVAINTEGLDAEDVATAIRSDALHPGEGGEVCARASDRDPGRSSRRHRVDTGGWARGLLVGDGRREGHHQWSLVLPHSSTASGPDTSSLPGRSFALTVHREAARSFRPLRRHPPSHQARPRPRPVPVEHRNPRRRPRRPRRRPSRSRPQPARGSWSRRRSFAPCQ